MDRYLIVSYNSAAKVSAITKSFREGQEVDMQKYIEQKTRAGIECHQFDYSASFKVESRIVQSNHA